MIYEFYGCLSGEKKEEGGRQRTGLEFQVVERHLLDVFLRAECKRQMVSEKHEEVFRAFEEDGMGHERFRKIKVRYLGDMEFRLLSVYFENLEYARYRYENWYFVRFSDEKNGLSGTVYDCSLYDWGGEDSEEINAYCNLEMLPREQAENLKKLYDPYLPEESDMRQEKEAGLKAIGAGTVFQVVRFVYVGAALCAVLLDNLGTEVAFFDLGTRVSGVMALAAKQPSAQNARNAILTCLQQIGPGNPMTIFISHWHVDHVNALGIYLTNHGNLNNIVNHSEWYVPASGCPMFMWIQGMVPAASFHAYPRGAAQAPVNVAGNPNIQVGKIDLQGNLHAHHQGLYVTITLASGNRVLLVGDTTYEGLPVGIRTNGGAGYDCLQVCHHGGDYYLPPANQNAGTAMGFIPTAAVGATAVYSADGRTYGHPDPFFVGHHQGQGYTAANEWNLNQGAVGGTFFRDYQ